MRIHHVLASTALALVAVPSLAAAQAAQPIMLPSPPPIGPERDGFTLELNLGLGVTMIAPEYGEGDSRNGLSGLNLGLGGWVSPQTAVTVRITGTSFEQNGTQLIAGMMGIVAQQMVTEAAWLGGGIGIGILTDDREDTEAESGLGLDFRAGYNFYQSRRNAFSASLEIQPGFFDGGRVTGVGVQLGWQHL